ncbi:hypothetical protein QQ045_026072 [Rhodiola kirilowii]
MASSLLSIVLLLLLSTTSASAFNITRLLGQFPEFGAFNDLLTQTHLNSEINSRLTITVLAVANESIGAISGKPLDVQKRILSNHVILDYYDTFKLQRLKKSSLLLTTLYQSTGLAQRQQGFLNVSVTSAGGIVFGSAVRGSPLNAKLLAGVASRPYNISVLQVSSPIVAPGMDPNEPLPPLPSPKKEAPPVAETPDQAASPEEETASPSPAESPVESPADSPAAEPPKNKKHKAADDDDDDVASSSAASVTAGVAVVVGLVSCLVA